MKLNRMNVGYHLMRNGTSTADKAPYLGVAVPVGSLAYDNILQRMLERGTFMTRATAQYFVDEVYEYAAKVISDDIVRINMGAVSIYPMIGGSFDSEDDEFRAPRNTLYVGATLSQEIREAVSGMSPTSLGAGTANGTVKISSVMDLASETYRLIDGLKEFRIAGIDLTVPDGEDESLSLVAANGVTKVADITVVSTEDGQRIVCTLASAVPAGTYHVRLVSHGLDPTAPLVTALHKVTVKAASPEPVWPEVRLVSVNGGADVTGGAGGCEIEGENLTLLDGDSVTAETEFEEETEPIAVTVVAAESTDTKIVLTYDPDSIYGKTGGSVTFTVRSRGGVAEAPFQARTITAGIGPDA